MTCTRCGRATSAVRDICPWCTGDPVGTANPFADSPNPSEPPNSSDPRKPSAKWEFDTIDMWWTHLAAHSLYVNEDDGEFAWRCGIYQEEFKRYGTCDSLESAQRAAEDALKQLLTDALKELG